MKEPAVVAVDTGTLVALSDDSDDKHKLCVTSLASLPVRAKLITIEPVITECFHLLRGTKGPLQRLSLIVSSPMITICSISQESIPRIVELMDKYRDSDIDFTDAALMTVCEQWKISTVFTLDRRDFEIYRPKHIKHFNLIP